MSIDGYPLMGDPDTDSDAEGALSSFELAKIWVAGIARLGLSRLAPYKREAKDSAG